MKSGQLYLGIDIYNTKYQILNTKKMGRKSNKNQWKNRTGIVYSTNEQHEYETNDLDEEDTLPKGKQLLRITLDSKKRAGKQVTLVTGFMGTNRDLKELSKTLKSRCGVGGSSKDGEIIIQGDFRQRVGDILKEMGYGVK